MPTNSGISPTLDALAEAFARLPGIGRKSALRLAYHIVNLPAQEVQAFADALMGAKQTLHHCKVCQNLSDGERCSICADPKRNPRQICVVSSARDVMTFERVKDFSGVYHVLHGSISPMDGIGPDQLKIRELIARVGEGVDEVILATNPNTEGEATAMYLARLIKPFNVKVTRIAYGIPVGAEIEFADDMTLFRALEGRREI